MTGLLLALSFYINTDAGDLAAESRTKLTVVITLLLSFFILLVGTGRWWHPHLWKHGNSQRQHKSRRRHSSRKHRRY
jgi:hypothetical protein